MPGSGKAIKEEEKWSLTSLFNLKAHYSCAKELYGLTLHEYDTLSLLKYCFIQL